MRAPFQRERLLQVGIDPWGAAGRDPFGALRALPPVTKTELRAAGEHALAGGRLDPSWHSSRSSGSTGEPFSMHYDPRCWALLKYVVKLRARLACGVLPWDRVAVLDAVPAKPPARLARIRTVSVLQPAESVANELAAFRPQAIYALPSALLEAAGALRARGTRLSPRVVFTSGELLGSALRQALVEKFGCRVHDVYGTSETKEIAWECRRGSAHVNADVLHVEVLDDAGRPSEPGEEGDIVVTLLVNRAMPLLRYRTGDRGRLAPGTCACGLALPLLGVVTGRETDTLTLPGDRWISPYVLTCALEAVPGMQRYQITQLAPDRLRVTAVVEPSHRAEAEARVRAAVLEATQTRLEVDVLLVERFEREPGVKFRVVQPLPPQGAAPSLVS
ncbi:MAG: phenylacetate--CoA ligase family protein [Gemmatimonadota bacterium]